MNAKPTLLHTVFSISDFARSVADDWRWQAHYDKRTGALTLSNYRLGIDVRHDLSVVARPFRRTAACNDTLMALTGVSIDTVQGAVWDGFDIKRSNLRDTGWFVETDDGVRHKMKRGWVTLHRVGGRYVPDPSELEPWSYAVLDKAETQRRRNRVQALLDGVEGMRAAISLVSTAGLLSVGYDPSAPAYRRLEAAMTRDDVPIDLLHDFATQFMLDGWGKERLRRPVYRIETIEQLQRKHP